MGTVFGFIVDVDFLFVVVLGGRRHFEVAVEIEVVSGFLLRGLDCVVVVLNTVDIGSVNLNFLLGLAQVYPEFLAYAF